MGDRMRRRHPKAGTFFLPLWASTCMHGMSWTLRTSRHAMLSGAASAAKAKAASAQMLTPVQILKVHPAHQSVQTI